MAMKKISVPVASAFVMGGASRAVAAAMCSVGLTLSIVLSACGSTAEMTNVDAVTETNQAFAASTSEGGAGELATGYIEACDVSIINTDDGQTILGETIEDGKKVIYKAYCASDDNTFTATPLDSIPDEYEIPSDAFNVWWTTNSQITTKHAAYTGTISAIRALNLVTYVKSFAKRAGQDLWSNVESTPNYRQTAAPVVRVNEASFEIVLSGGGGDTKGEVDANYTEGWEHVQSFYGAYNTWIYNHNGPTYRYRTHSISRFAKVGGTVRFAHLVRFSE